MRSMLARATSSRNRRAPVVPCRAGLLQSSPTMREQLRDTRCLVAKIGTSSLVDAAGADIWLLPIDAPYGGKPTGKPRFIGRDSKSSDGLSIKWTRSEPDEYVKLFAVVYPRKNPELPVRSASLDVAIGGDKLRKKPAGRP